MDDSTAFAQLSRGGQTRRLRRLADAALSEYAVRPVRVARLPLGFNATFRVDAADGGRYALRVHRPEGPTAAMVRSELTWLSALHRDTDLKVPDPVATQGGELLTVATAHGVPEARTCDLLRWVDGRFVDDRLTPLHLQRVGSLMARLHLHATEYVPPQGFERPRVDNVTYFAGTQSDNLSSDVVAHAASLVDEVHEPGGSAIVVAVLERARAARGALGGAPDVFGLIHADLHQENYLFSGNDVHAIDFDDCGYGLFVQDLAVTLSEIDRRDDYPALREALLAGYRRERPLAADHEQLLDAFIDLRRLQLMLYVVEERTAPMFRDWWAKEVTHVLGLLSAPPGRWQAPLERS